MQSDAAVWALIVGMAVINFLERFTPLALVSRMALPKAVERWLTFVPIAVMGTLFATEVLQAQGAPGNPLAGAWFWAAAVTALVYRLTRSFLGATLAGMASFVLLQSVLG